MDTKKCEGKEEKPPQKYQHALTKPKAATPGQRLVFWKPWHMAAEGAALQNTKSSLLGCWWLVPKCCRSGFVFWS